MHKLLFFSLIAGLFVFSCTRKLGVSSDDLQQKINLTVDDWDNLSSEANLSYENIHSWVPESGIRGRYEIASKVLGKSVLESLIGEKVFLSGVPMKPV